MLSSTQHGPRLQLLTFHYVKQLEQLKTLLISSVIESRPIRRSVALDAGHAVHQPLAAAPPLVSHPSFPYPPLDHFLYLQPFVKLHHSGKYNPGVLFYPGSSFLTHRCYRLRAGRGESPILMITHRSFVFRICKRTFPNNNIVD